MSQSLTDINIHLVFSTKNRLPLIQPSTENELYMFITGICRNLGSPLIQINGMPDHIHILLILGRTISISQLTSEIKSNSSRWIKSKGTEYRDFAWQSGYGGFSVSRSNIDRAIKYISNQKEHHKKVTFQEELLILLKRGQIQYDEKYLWD